MIADIEIFSSEAFREKKARKITRDSHDKGKEAENPSLFERTKDNDYKNLLCRRVGRNKAEFLNSH